MTDFDVARIVPSVRDFAGAVRTPGEGLALVPAVAGGDLTSQAGALEALSVRALAVMDAGESLLAIAQATRSTPIVCTQLANSVHDCQAARFFGADAVVLSAARFDELAKTVQSMRMMPVGLAVDRASADSLVSAGARVFLVSGALESVLDVAGHVGRAAITLADVAGLDVDGLRTLAGAPSGRRVHAALVATSVHQSPTFEALLDELDG